jgi:tRNA threonylcarbamoyladenosine biosynthesis protein TsaB
MILLALDTALSACAVAVLKDGAVLAQGSEAMERGHQERLAPMAAEAMAAAGLGFADLDRIAVTVGPGSFTGLRVGLAFAKGLSAALDRPCIGVGTLAALAAEARGPVAAVIDARRERVYLQPFRDGEALAAAEMLSIAEAAARVAGLAGDGPVRLVGPGSPLLSPLLPAAVAEATKAPDVAALGRLAARLEPAGSPQPLYLRAADARTLAERAAAGSR